jgi:mono/diheme cytochrome c family protein
MALKRVGFRDLAAVLVLGGAIVGLSANVALAQDEVSMGPRGQLNSAQLDFRQHCAQCHGMDGTGDGPVAPALKKKPANLTRLYVSAGDQRTTTDRGPGQP